MIHQLAKAHGESSDIGRHEHISTAGCLRSSLQNAVVHRPHFVGMIAEIRCTSSVIERELTANKQAAFMVTGRKRPTECGTSFPITHVRISKEHT